MAPKKISEKYQKLEPREHILLKPGMWIGSIEPDTCDVYVVDDASNRIVKKTLQHIPGLYKIIDEILVNAIDHAVRLKTLKQNDDTVTLMKFIKVTIDKTTGVISVHNDGNGIDIVKHPEHDIYIPELIFGHLMTSTNYDETEEKIIGGTNGIGSKACNIFSEWFEVETVDSSRKLLYKQKFEKNMSLTGTPTVSRCTKKPYTIIRFLPDYAKFGLQGMTEDI